MPQYIIYNQTWITVQLRKRGIGRPGAHQTCKSTIASHSYGIFTVKKRIIFNYTIIEIYSVVGQASIIQIVGDNSSSISFKQWQSYCAVVGHKSALMPWYYTIYMTKLSCHDKANLYAHDINTSALMPWWGLWQKHFTVNHKLVGDNLVDDNSMWMIRVKGHAGDNLVQFSLYKSLNSWLNRGYNYLNQAQPNID